MVFSSPGWFFARQLFKKLKPKEAGKQLFDVIEVEKNAQFDPRCIDVYEYVIKNHVEVQLRNGNWAQEFYRLDEMMTYVDTQFSDKEFSKKNILKQKEANNGQ